jgi:hypothetical protein
MALDLETCADCRRPVHYRGWRSVVYRGDGVHCDRLTCSVRLWALKVKLLFLDRVLGRF